MNVLAVDIGNTDLKFGLFSDGELARHWRMPGSRLHPEKFSALLRDCLSNEGVQFESVVYSTVVPEIETAFRTTIHYCYQLPDDALLAVDPTRIRLPIDPGQYPLAQLGMDRLVNACAARLALPERNVIVVDFGTATTLDLVSMRGQYLGGAILPGLDTFSESLSLRTSRLPAIRWDEPDSGPALVRPEGMGQDTIACLRAGLSIGYRGALKELMQTARREFDGGEIRRVATGGLAKTVIKLCGLEVDFEQVDEFFTLKGLLWLHDYNRQAVSSS